MQYQVKAFIGDIEITSEPLMIGDCLKLIGKLKPITARYEIVKC
jgi:hypothetical protein